QPWHRFDHPDQLRRPEHAAELAEARREVSDAHGAALAVGQHRRYHGGIAQIFRLIVRHVVEHDVGKALLVVAGQKAAEDRVAVEARIAPPHQTRFRVDERSRAPVADDSEVEPVIGHEVAKASLWEMWSSQRRTSVGSSKRASMPGTWRPTEMPMPSKSGRMSNTPRSVMSSPMNTGRRPANGG